MWFNSKKKWFNSEPRTIQRYKVKYAIYMYNEPRTFLNVQVLFKNVAPTIDSSIIGAWFFLQLYQMYKCGLKVRHTSTTKCFDDRYVIDF